MIPLLFRGLLSPEDVLEASGGGWLTRRRLAPGSLHKRAPEEAHAWQRPFSCPYSRGHVSLNLLLTAHPRIRPPSPAGFVWGQGVCTYRNHTQQTSLVQIEFRCRREGMVAWGRFFLSSSRLFQPSWGLLILSRLPSPVHGPRRLCHQAAPARSLTGSLRRSWVGDVVTSSETASYAPALSPSSVASHGPSLLRSLCSSWLIVGLDSSL